MDPISNIEELEENLSRPTAGVIETMRRLEGDVIILGVGGKMGPTLARMVRRASDEAGVRRRVIGVARFSNANLPEQLERDGIEPITADLLDRAALARLPDAPNVVSMIGMKFGSTGQESLTWAMNCYVPGMICERYRNSRIVTFSTGNVYSLVPRTSGGSRETDHPGPVGEYAISALGRERIVEHFSRTLKIPCALIRLNYAVELRYGVLVDVAQKIFYGHPVDVSMGYANVIWQQEAAAMSLMAFDRCSTPPFVLNVAGPEILSIREVAHQFARLLNKPAHVIGHEASDALLNDGSMGHQTFFRPAVTADEMIEQIAGWISAGGHVLGKPTHFEARDGRF
jgi:nucleoside-diphosphate-sugar epimerase